MQKSNRLILLSLLTLSGVLLNACASTKENAANESPQANLYQDGSYSSIGNYQSPAGPVSIAVDLSIKDNVVTSVTVSPQAENETARLFQEKFAGGISAAIVGMSLDELNVREVAGSSLTPIGFNNALADIKASAAL